MKKSWILHLLSSSSEVSFKRTLGVCAFVLLAIGYVADTFWNVKLDPVIVEPIKYVCAVSVGAVAVENVASLLSPKSNPATDGQAG
jgi:hypothetical protein